MREFTEGSQLCGRFTLIDRIGSGGHAEVWRAHDLSNDTHVALKVLYPQVARSPEAWESLRREYRISQRLAHPGIIEVGEPLRDDDCTIIPMTLATGDLRRLRGEPYTRIVPALVAVASALEHAHSRGVVHRDLKPSNVLIDAEGRMLVADFGIAALDGEAPEPLLGSPFTASPQQLSGEPPGVADDIWGLGAMAYELLSGYPPFYPNFDARAAAQPVPELLPIHPVPPRLSRLVMRLLAHEPAQRPASMAEVAEELRACLFDTLAESVSALGLAPEARDATTITAAASALADPSAASATPPYGAPEPEPEPAEASRPAASASNATPPFREVLAATAAASAVAPTAPEGTAATEVTAAREASPVATADAAREAPPEGAAVPLRIPESTLEFDGTKLELPRRSRRGWVWAAVAVLAAAAVASFVWLPRFAAERAALTAPPTAARPAASGADAPATGAAGAAAREAAAREAAARAEAQQARAAYATARDGYAKQFADLESRGAGIWGGTTYAAAQALAADAEAALQLGSYPLAADRMRTAARRLERVAAGAADAAQSQLEAGERALQAGQTPVARQAFELALRIDPQNERAREGLRRAGGLESVLPALAEAETAAANRDYAAAIRKYDEVLRADPQNVAARDGLARARAASASDAYASAIGEALSALRGGDLGAAGRAIERAAAQRPGAPEVAAIRTEIASRGASLDLGDARARAEQFEAQERWTEARAEYARLLAADPSLEFARTGQARTAPRAELSTRLQGLIDAPERLAAPEVRADARGLLARARGVENAGPVLRSQVARLELLLPEYEKPVRVAIASNGETRVTIQRVGDIGLVTRQEIDLQPGRYVAIGTRAGYRDVRREFVVAPGQAPQTIEIACVEPI